MTVVSLGVFSETQRPVLSLSSVSMSLIITQKHVSSLTATTSTLLSPTLESLLLLLLLSPSPFPRLCPHFIQVSTQTSLSKKPFPVKRNKTSPHRPHLPWRWPDFLFLSGIIVFSAAGSWSAVWTECSQRCEISSQLCSSWEQCCMHAGPLVHSCWKISLEPHIEQCCKVRSS